MPRLLLGCALALACLPPCIAQELPAASVQVTDAISGQAAPALTLDLTRLPAPAEARGALGLNLGASARDADGAAAMTIVLTDLRGEDRAVDLDVSFAVPLSGWALWHDINCSEPIGDRSFTERQYPLLVVTGPDAGLCLAVEPSQPFVYELRADAGGLHLHAPLGLTPAGTGEVESRAEVRLYLFPTPAEDGFRGALDRYYRMFPEAFERRAMDEGMWLFAFENTRLPNPSHYAYHEGGPTGWQYDEEHAIGTYPYTEVSSRTVHVPYLPDSREEALKLWADMIAGKYGTPAAWGLRGGELDDTVARGGTRSLRCHKDDPAAWTGGMQDIEVKQQAAEPITISGWLRAENATGGEPGECSLYADVLLTTGEWAFGNITPFEPGTHDWQQATGTFEFPAPVQMVRLHALFRTGFTGTGWFDDISVTAASAPERNLCLNPGFEQLGGSRDTATIEAYALHAADGHPYFSITDNVGSDVRPATPMKLLRFTLNPSPYLQSVEGAEPPPGVKWIDQYQRMMEGIPQLDGAYIDSVSSWATRCLDFRRENWYCMRNPFTYDPESKRVVAAGKYYTYDFLRELQRALNPDGRYVFTNIHNTMDTFLLYAVSDVPGIESSITTHERFAYIRSASYHKPAVLLNFLNLHGFEQRAKHDEHWRLAMLYGLYPSIGRRCDEAYELYGDLYRRFMPSLKRISAAGWEPLTHATLDPPGSHIERFGSTADALFFTVLNESDERWTGRLQLDYAALGISPTDLRALDTTTGAMSRFGGASARVSVGPRDVAVFQVGTPEALADTALREWVEIEQDLQRLEAELGDQRADLIQQTREGVAHLYGVPAPEIAKRTITSVTALCNSEDFQVRTWTGETAGQALMRGMMLTLRRLQTHNWSVEAMAPDTAVAGEMGQAKIKVEPGVDDVELHTVLNDGEDVSSAARQFRWPTEGYGPGLVDVTCIAVGTVNAAVTKTVHLRPAIELRLETAEPSRPMAERGFVARCVNNSATARTAQVTVELPGEGWTATPAQSGPIAIPAHGTADFAFTVRAPEGMVRMAPIRATAREGEDSYAGETVALCGAPGEPEPNLARAEGVTITGSGNYPGGYTPTAVADGLIWPEGVHFTVRAWASVEAGGDDWAQFRWAQPVSVSQVIIYWQVYQDRPHTARQVLIQVPEGEGWRTVLESAPAPDEAATALRFEPVRTDRLRILQPAGQGPEHRPNLMWITEVQIGE